MRSCGSGLGGVLLGFAEFGDCFGERGQPGDEHEWGDRPVLGDVGEGPWLSAWRDGVDGGLGCHREVSTDVDALYLDDRQGVLAGLRADDGPDRGGYVRSGALGADLVQALLRCRGRASRPHCELRIVVWPQISAVVVNI